MELSWQSATWHSQNLGLDTQYPSYKLSVVLYTCNPRISEAGGSEFMVILSYRVS